MKIKITVRNHKGEKKVKAQTSQRPELPEQYVAGTHLYTWVKRDKVE